MNVDQYIESMTPDVRMRRILKKAAMVDDTPASRCVMNAFLSSQLSALIKLRTPRLRRAAQAFVRAPPPKNTYRGLQLYIWLNEKVPEGQNREILILLGMQMYLEQEAKADAGRSMVNYMAVQ